MLTRICSGSYRYFSLIALFLGTFIVGLSAYLTQLSQGLTVTGLSRDVPWGTYIAQFTFLVGVAASAVMVVLPYYLHDFKAFSKIVIVGEALAVSATITCLLFVFVDMGRPDRVLNVLLYPSPNSPMFWDMLSLLGYLVLNLIIAYVTLDAERKGAPPRKWIRAVIILSIPWAVSIHTVTAFLYSGLASRHLFFTAILAPRFLASAFAAGPSVLILLCLLLKRAAGFDPGKEALLKLKVIVTYAMVINVFFILLELFTALYGGVPSHAEHIEYLYLGLGDKAFLSPFLIASSILAILSLPLLLIPSLCNRPRILVVALISVIISLWLDKGLGLVIAGFVPNPLGYVREYRPTGTELLIALGVLSLGGLLLTLLLKIIVSVRKESEG
jgi:molybdopterin-containing oxidoreductase family membrane subunit